jgi:hypothetical protein
MDGAALVDGTLDVVGVAVGCDDGSLVSFIQSAELHPTPHSVGNSVPT